MPLSLIVCPELSYSKTLTKYGHKCRSKFKVMSVRCSIWSMNSTKHSKIVKWLKFHACITLVCPELSYPKNFNLTQTPGVWHKLISTSSRWAKNYPTMTKFEFDLHNPKMYPYTKFELNVCTHSRDNERKPISEWQNDEG